MVQCVCLKGNGDQCTRQTNVGSPYCWQHQNCSTPVTHSTVTVTPKVVTKIVAPTPIPIPTQTDSQFEDSLKAFFKHALKADLVDTIVKFGLAPNHYSISHIKSACNGALYDWIREKGKVIPQSYFDEIEAKHLLHKDKKAQAITLKQKTELPPTQLPPTQLPLAKLAIPAKSGIKIPLKIKDTDNRKELIEIFSKEAIKPDYVKAIIQFKLDPEKRPKTTLKVMVVNDLKQIMNDHLDQVPTTYFAEMAQKFTDLDDKAIQKKKEFETWFTIPEIGDTAQIKWHSSGQTHPYMVMSVKNKGKDVDFLYTGPPLQGYEKEYSFDDQPFKLKYLVNKGWVNPKHEWIKATVKFSPMIAQ